jgi:hypothetical protein
MPSGSPKTFRKPAQKRSSRPQGPLSPPPGDGGDREIPPRRTFAAREWVNWGAGHKDAQLGRAPGAALVVTIVVGVRAYAWCL